MRLSTRGSARPCRSAAIGTESSLEEQPARGEFTAEPAAPLLLIVSDAMMAGIVRMLRSESAVGPFVLGLHEKREKVPHPGLQHVQYAH